MARLPRFVIPGQPQHASPVYGRGRFAVTRTRSAVGWAGSIKPNIGDGVNVPVKQTMKSSSFSVPC